jgi:hypothetical protein
VPRLEHAIVIAHDHGEIIDVGWVDIACAVLFVQLIPELAVGRPPVRRAEERDDIRP